MRLLLFVLGTVAIWASDRWNMSYFHDQDQSSLLLRGIAFTDETHGVAVGVLTNKGSASGVAMVTADAGANWASVKLKDEPLSVTCMAQTCWYAAPKAVWRSDEGGREWKKVSGQKGIFKMQFVSATKGFAAGLNKMAWITEDAGKTWTEVPQAKEIKADADHTQFNTLSFVGDVGIIGGNTRFPRMDDSPFPDWMVPDSAARRRELPGLMMTLETRDGGKTWASSTMSVFGLFTSIRIRPDGAGALGLLEYFHTFEVPSEVMWVDFRGGKSTSIFRDKSVSVTDAYPLRGNDVVLAGIATAGLRSLPLPQKVMFLKSNIVPGSVSVVWTKMDVDYRAIAQRVSLGQTPSGRLFAVTDTGMILRLDADAPKAP